jgi:hypothetical protein
MVRTIPQAQVAGFPRRSGDDRFLAKANANLRQRSAYSSLRNSRQKASVISISASAIALAWADA